MEEKKKSTFKNILKKAGEYFGAIVIFIVTIFMVITDKIFDASGKMYIHAITIVIIAYIVVFIAALVITLIFKLSSFNKNLCDQLNEDFNSKTQKVTDIAEIIQKTNTDMKKSLDLLSKNIEKEKGILTELSIGNYVLDSNAVIELEESVGNYNQNGCRCKIYIQSSLFVLEKGSLEKGILWNLRKGVKYLYIIPKKESYINDYCEMLHDWYKLYSQFLISKEKYDSIVEEFSTKENEKYFSFWDSDYKKMFNQAGTIWKNNKLNEAEKNARIADIRNKLQQSFIKLIETHIDDESEFYITVAAYEVKRNKWEAIIKLPTEHLNNEYYAFQIPSKNSGEHKTFIHNFQDRFKNIEYNPDDISTLGGRYNLNYSQIFN